MLTIGKIAKTYGVLPSQVLQQANTFDLMITDVMTTWESYSNNPTDMDNYNEDELVDLVKKSRQ
jgi:hypothetical protein